MPNEEWKYDNNIGRLKEEKNGREKKKSVGFCD